MHSKSRFADELREHVCNALLNDDVIDLAYETQLDFDEVMGFMSMLSGPSPLDPFSGVQAPGRDMTCARCAQVRGSFRANLMVG